ncbi:MULTISPECIES: hypothetical protein [unclassified Microcoleus]|uniref:hypothetical protein n=1 Tax=unclassified Microcoleus TaxID=2642155 RepID=UPI002FD17595
MVIASLRHERQIAMEAERAIEQLTVKQVVAWFVKDEKIRRQQGVDAAFLDLLVKGRSAPLANNTSNSAIGGGFGRSKKSFDEGVDRQRQT